MQPEASTSTGGPLARRAHGLANGGALARGLGWFSIGLGVALVGRPRGVADMIGAPKHARSRATLFGVGIRELAAGVGLLTRPRSSFAWSRVAGDVMDLMLLARARRSRRANPRKLRAAMASVVGIGIIDVMAALRLGNGRSIERRLGGAREVTATITIHRPQEEVFRFFRQLDNLPRFMAHLRSVDVLDDRRSRWAVNGPAGTVVQWEAEIYDLDENRLIAWRSVAGADVDNAGVVRFNPAPGGRGTEVHVQLRYHAPGGAIGIAVARLLGREPRQQVSGDLRRLKQMLEVGEVVHSDASIHRGMYPAQPPRNGAGPRPSLPHTSPIAARGEEEKRS